MQTLTVEQALQKAMSENNTPSCNWETIKPYPYTPRAVLCKVDVSELYSRKVDKWIKMRMG